MYKKLKFYYFVSSKIFKSLFLFDSWHNLNKSSFLIIRKEENLNMSFQSKKYSPIADTLKFYLDSEKISSQIICKPYAYSNNQITYNKFFSLNYSYLKISLYKYFLKIFVNDEKVLKKRIKLWKKIFIKSQPKVIICIEAGKEICAAANQLNIKIFDYQHGQINEYNPSYNNRLFNMKNIYLPTGYLCWDQNTKNYLLNNFKKKNKKITVIDVGNLWFKRFFQPIKNDQLLSEFKNLNFNTKKKKILISLMPMKHQVNEKNNIDYSIFLPQVLNDILKDDEEYYWCIRLHPLLMTKKYLKIFKNYFKKNFSLKNNIDWKLSSFNPLPNILKEIDLHITDYSNVTIEAAMMNIKTILLNKNIRKGKKLQNIYLSERLSKKAFVIENDKKILLKWIKSNIKSKKNNGKLNFSSFKFNNLKYDKKIIE